MLDENPDAVRSADGSRFLLAVFGKHPAWSDHLEDIGIDTPSLAAFKRWLYVDGIRTNLDTGAWERLPDDHKLAEWNHRLFMTGPKGMLIARLWATSDGRGRRAYPMVAVTHLPTTRLPADLGPLFDVLDDVRERCIAADTQDEVRAAALHGRGALESAVKLLSPLPPGGPSMEERSRFIAEHGQAGFGRVLHVMSSDLAPFSPSNKTKRGGPIRPRTFRLPVPLTDPETDLLIWHAFFQPHLRPETLWTAVHPIGTPWADVLVGDLDIESVFLFRASPGEVPLISDIPYSIPSEREAIFSTILKNFVTPPFVIPLLNEDESSPGKLGSVMGRLFGRGS